MAAASGKWDDLIARLGSAVVMVAVAALGLWLGGVAFKLLIAAICGAMVWELVRMINGGVTTGMGKLLGLLCTSVLIVSAYLPPGLALPLLIAPAFVGLSQLRQNRSIFMSFSVAIMLAGFGLIALRDDFGMAWMLWLVLVVVVTDVAGYFAGRMIGGPKFWPKVSPKKTWSGTVAGWIGAAIVGVLYWAFANGGPNVVGVSIALSMASQLGDIAESATKRRLGIKDSSNLIPGHGGVMDRFDGMLGAALFLLLVEQVISFPPAVGP